LLRRNSVQALYKGYYYDKINANNTSAPSTKQNTGSQIIDSVSKEVLDGQNAGEELDAVEIEDKNLD
jgi:hypothetical protein